MSELFDSGFLDLLQGAMRRVRSLRARRAESELRARKFVGAARGAFAGHRPYAAGVDVRDVDWHAYARTRELYAKTFEEDERRTLTILLDTTGSMRAEDRFDGARRLAALLGALAIVRGDNVRLVTQDGSVHAFEGADGLRRLLVVLDQCPAGVAGPSADPIELVRVPIERGFAGSFCWLSDFADPDSYAPALRRMRRSGRRCTGVLPAVDADASPFFGTSGLIELVDPETGEREVVQFDAALRGAVERELGLLRRRQAATFAATGGRLQVVQLPERNDYRLESWVRGDWISYI